MNGGGGGGGGVIYNGVPTTFYSAGFYSDPQPMQSEEIPGLNSLISFIRNDSALSMMIKSKLLQLLVPVSGRSYYRVSEEAFTSDVLEKLEGEYVKAIKAPKEHVVIYAITKGLTTYLLPNFFKLQSETQMQAILLHELLWTTSVKRTYEEVIQAEMAAQAFLEDPGSPRKRLAFAYYFGDVDLFKPQKQSIDYLKSAIEVDFSEGNLAGLLRNDGTIDFKNIVGPGFFNCEGCSTTMTDVNLYELRQKYPRSEFLKLLKIGELMFSPDSRYVDYCHGNFGYNYNCIDLRYTEAKDKNILVNDVENVGVKVDYTKCVVSLGANYLIQKPYPLVNPPGKPQPFAGLPVSCPNLKKGLFLKAFAI